MNFFHSHAAPSWERHPWRTCIAALGVGVLLGTLAALLQPANVEGSRSFTVQNRRTVPAGETAYDYEGYYTLQTANEAAKVLVSWLVSPGGTRAVYTDAGVERRFRDLRDYELAFSIRRADTPFFEVRFEAKTAEEASQLTASMEKLLRERLAAFQNSDSLSLDASPAVATAPYRPIARTAAYGGVLGFFGAAFVLLFRKTAALQEA